MKYIKLNAKCFMSATLIITIPFMFIFYKLTIQMLEEFI